MKSKVPAADQTLRILTLLAQSRGPLQANMISSQLDIPRSTLYHLLGVLQEHGYVLHLPEEKRYGLGLAAVELSSAYARHEPLTRIGRPLISALVDSLHISGHLCMAQGTDVIYLIEERAPHSPSLVSDVNVRLPMHLTASGRAILAALPKAQVRALYPNSAAFTSRNAGTGQTSIDRYSRLRRVLDETTSRGFAVEVGAITEGFSSVAVPVFDHRHWPIAAIALTFRDEEYGAEDYAALADAIRETASVLSSRIHGRLG